MDVKLQLINSPLVRLSVRTVTFVQNNSDLDIWHVGSSSYLKVRVKGQRSRSHNDETTTTTVVSAVRVVNAYTLLVASGE